MAPSSILHLRLARRDGESPQERESGPLAAFCRRTTPSWDWASQGVYLDMTGTDRLYGRGIDGASCVTDQARGTGDILAAGAAPTRLAAKLASFTAARSGGGVLAILPGQTASFLQPFPVHFLPGKRSVIQRLQQLGVRSLGDLQVVPRSLLRSVFGESGCRLAEEASGRGEQVGRSDSRSPEGGSAALELVVGVRLSRPVSSSAVISALRRGLAVRALTLCPDGPYGYRRWRLTAVWPEGLRDSVTGRGPEQTGWKVWLKLVDLLWERLPLRRKGLVGLELCAGMRTPGRMRQDSLFPADDADARLAAALRRSRLRAGGDLGPACTDLPGAREAVWYGPGEVMSKPGHGFG